MADRFRIEEWVFKFERMFDNALVRGNFGAYLSSVHNADPFNFYLEVEELKRLRALSNQVSSARSIVDKYIRHNSRHEINIDRATRVHILDMVEKLGLDRPDVEQSITAEQQIALAKVFNNAQNNVFREMKEDNFPRYLRSKQFARLVRDNPTLLNAIASRRAPTVSYRELPADIDTYEARIRESDFSLVQELAQDSTYDWRLMIDCRRTGIAVYVSSFEIGVAERLPDDDDDDDEDEELCNLNESTLSMTSSATVTSTTSNTSNSSSGSSGFRPGTLQLFKFVGTVKHNYHVVCSALADPGLRQRIEPNLMNTIPLEFLPAVSNGTDDPSQDRLYSSSVFRQTLNIGKLFKPRELVKHISLNHFPDTNRYVFAFKSAMHKKADMMNSGGKVRLTMFGGQILQKIDDDTTRYTSLMLIDVGKRALKRVPLVGRRIFKALGTRRARRMHCNLVEVCKQTAAMFGGDIAQLASISLESTNLLAKTMLNNEKILTPTTDVLDQVDEDDDDDDDDDDEISDSEETDQ